MYMLGLMMEFFWPAGKAVRVTEESDERLNG